MAKAFNLLLTLVGGVLQTYADPSAKYGQRSTRKVSILLRSLTMFFLASGGLCLAQQGGQDISKTAPVPPQQPSNRSESDAPSFMVKAVTNIVVVDLVAGTKKTIRFETWPPAIYRSRRRLAGPQQYPKG